MLSLWRERAGYSSRSGLTSLENAQPSGEKQAMAYIVHTLMLESGARLGIGPLPSEADIAALQDWQPGAVVSMTTSAEMRGLGLGAAFGPIWHHFPIADFGAPRDQAAWDALSPKLHAVLDGGGGVFAHCYGGKGRSGLVLLRLMVERGFDPDEALASLRAVRPGAVENEAQRQWAIRRG